MNKYMNLKPAYKRSSSGGSSGGKQDKSSGKKQTKCTLRAGNEYIRGITGSSSIVSNYGTLNSMKNGTSKSTTSTFGKGNNSTLSRSTLGKSHSIFGGKSSNNNNGTLNKSTTSSSSTGRISLFGLRRK